jgi:hypothetical protein
LKLRGDGRPDGRSKRATFQTWLREHAPLVHIGLYSDPGDELARAAEYRRRRELIERAKIRREALAFCIECHYPLVASETGFQFCPYERTGQHAKVKAAAESEERESAVGASGLVLGSREARFLARPGRATIRRRRKPNPSGPRF